MKTKIRGQEVDIFKPKKLIVIHIYKPKNKTFSLSDKLLSYTKKGYAIKVILPDGEKLITYHTRPFCKEEVPSHFPGAYAWKRYWFAYKPEVKGQLNLFGSRKSLGVW